MTAFIRTTTLAAIAGLLASTIGGCAASQGSRALPSAANGAEAQASPVRSNAAALLKGPMTQSRLLQLQMQGRLPAPVPLRSLRYQVAQPAAGRPRPALHPDGKVGVWVSNTNFNYVLGQNAAGTQTETAIDAGQNGCYSPVALKVDHSRNLWVGCELTSPSTVSGAVQEYGPSGSLTAQYVAQCPKNVAGCSSFGGYGFDSGLDAQRDVFASMNLYSYEVCNPSCTTTLGAGFEWWAHGASPSSKPKLISVGANCAPVCGVGYMDVDASGNLWFDFSGYNSTGTYGFGLGEIKNPTTRPAFKIVEPIGTYQFFGGVYASGKGTVLNVIDQTARTVSQYKLPVATGGKPFAVLGPTPTTVFSVGDPISGGFNQTESKMAIGDSGAWIDVGAPSSNVWTTPANLNFYSGIDGAAYTPSDK